MVRLSVNVNKVATLRNSRGGVEPRVLDAVAVCLAAGVTGITVHPRADQRHITPDDVRDIAAHLRPARPAVEFNMEGDPRPEFIEMVHAVRPEQCTIVPVIPGEITSQAGWTRGADTDRLPAVIAAMKADGIRVSLFIDATDEAVVLAGEVGADRVELYTEPFARAFQLGRAAAEESFATYAAAAERARPRPRHQRGARSRPGQSGAVPDPSAPRRSLDWACPHVEGAVCRARHRRSRVSGRPGRAVEFPAPAACTTGAISYDSRHIP